MSVDNDLKHGGGASNSQLEVDKLKQLVKKLEKQNEHLRKKSGKLSPNPRSGGDAILYANKSHGDNNSDTGRPTGKNVHDKGWFPNEKNHSFADENDETSWLYELPIANNLKKQPLTPKNWLKSELENPSTPQLKAAKEDILNQLNPPSYTSPVFSNYSTPIKVITTGRVPVYSEIINRKEDISSRTTLTFSDDETTNNTNFIENEKDVKTEQLHDNDNSNANSPPLVKSATSPVHAHHMPLPSHTRTTMHGLSPSRPSSTSRYRSPSPNIRSGSQVKTRRSASFDRNEKRRSESPKISSRPQSPAETKPVSRQSLPATTRGRTASPKPNINYGLTKDINNKSNLMRFKPGTPSTNEIKSKLGTPRQLRQPSKLAAPSSGASYDLIKNNNASSNRSTTPRRSLPRPSQTSTKNQFMHKKPTDETGSASPKLIPPNKLGSNGTNSPRGSDAGSDVVWSEGEFF